MNNYPRIVIGGLSGDSGKTMITCGLLECLRASGVNVAAFKKGPDYIDAAWLSLSSGKLTRNLDTYLMGTQKVKGSFLRNASAEGINIIEGNRGLFDGVDSQGTHSTAELAKLLQAPVIIVLNVSKMTRTAAALVFGCKFLDSELNILGVILNRVAGKRHIEIAKESIEGETGIPVLGTIPKLPAKFILPERHLGLITPAEFEKRSSFLKDMRCIIKDNVDIPKIKEIAFNAPSISYDPVEAEAEPGTGTTNKFTGEAPGRVKIGFFRDKSFSFYYPENLEALEMAGAELIPVSSTEHFEPDDIDAFYIGGGFPELNLPGLSSNKEMTTTIKRLAEGGLPIYAECGGLIYLAEEIIYKGKKYSLSGVLPVSINLHNKPQGHGYCEMTVDRENPFYNTGTKIKGHEFHYSKIFKHDPDIKSCLSVSRGYGCYDGRDGLSYKNVFASYVHIHALATPEWAGGMIRCAQNYKEAKTTSLAGTN